jgi:hypothetical protein
MNLAELDVRLLFGIIGLVKFIGFNYIFGFKKGRQDKRMYEWLLHLICGAELTALTRQPKV